VIQARACEGLNAFAVGFRESLGKAQKVVLKAIRSCAFLSTKA
jgi:hypothetical protein